MNKTNNYRLNYYKEVNEDLIQIEKYIVLISDSFSLGHKSIEKIRKSIQGILPFPNSFPLVNNALLNEYKIRKKACGKYLIFFRVDEDNVEIIAVFHSRRNIENIYKEISFRAKQNHLF